MEARFHYVKLEDTCLYLTDSNALRKLVDGYIRKIRKIVQQIVPTDISKICILYLLQKKSYFTIYDTNHAEIKTINNFNGDLKDILPKNSLLSPTDVDHRCYICRDGHASQQSISCNNCSSIAHIFCAGLLEKPDSDWYCSQCMMEKAGNTFTSIQVLKGKSTNDPTCDIVFLSEFVIDSGVHELTFQCIKPHANDKIGIISEGDLDTLKKGHIGKTYLYQKTFGEYRYFWWCHTRTVRAITKASSNRIPIQGIGRWAAGHYIGMIIDCNKWTIQFKLNQCKSQIFDIEADIKYYAVLSMGDGDALYLYDMA